MAARVTRLVRRWGVPLMPSSNVSALAARLAQLSAREMVAALGVRNAPPRLASALALPFHVASRKLGQTLAEFDATLETRGLRVAAGRALERFGVAWRVASTPPAQGPLLVLANHPGAYDALGLMSAIARDDLCILAADREFLHALPSLTRQLLFVGERTQARAGVLKRALGHLRRGGALLHFPAGEIEPDADFAPPAAQLLKPWQPGVEALVKATLRVGGQVWVTGVRGVHSPRAKRWAINRWAERRGVTTLSPLLQMVVGLRDVSMRIECRAVDMSSGTELSHSATLRAALESTLSGLP
jgi:hypothetical protein